MKLKALFLIAVFAVTGIVNSVVAQKAGKGSYEKITLLRPNKTAEGGFEQYDN